LTRKEGEHGTDDERVLLLATHRNSLLYDIRGSAYSKMERKRWCGTVVVVVVVVLVL